VIPVARDLLGALAGKLSFKALLRQRVRCVSLPLPTVKRPILPWALFPFKVPYLSPAVSLEKSLSEKSNRPLNSAASGVLQGSGVSLPRFVWSVGAASRSDEHDPLPHGRNRDGSTLTAEAVRVDDGPKPSVWAPTGPEPKFGSRDVVRGTCKQEP